jgi:Uma2 family endonuclease
MRVFGDRWLVRPHAPIVLGRDSRPEPDISVVEGGPDDYFTRAPRRAALVVEVSDSSLRFDRGRKAAVYAGGGVADYWIVNLVEKMLEVYRDPRRRVYGSVERIAPDGTVSPLAIPNAVIDVSDLVRS